uniref:NADH dehydrogenase subunit 2 n=1 Tax=Tenerodus fallax TaxID=2069446 RepID=UPI001FAFDD65|nr:NADH dehydrogenase subunit 2 [Tenerodus fallax]UKP88393.1 NADH dehydrogenase subunit 2 [Tenerodus fallax]
MSSVPPVSFLRSYLQGSASLSIARFSLTAIVVSLLVSEIPLCWTQTMRGLVLLGGLAISSMTRNEEGGVFLLLVLLGNYLLIGATNLISVYIALELQTLSLFVLVAYNKRSLLSAEAGLKYFVLGALSSGLFLFGCALVYGSTGELELHLIRVAGAERSLGLLFIVVSLLFKISAAPFHMWAPDVYGGAPTWVVALLSIVPKLGVLAVLVQIGLDPRVFLVAGLMSMAVGAIGALNQTKTKRLLAYSGISHMGFVLLGVAIGSTHSLQATLMYVGAYVITQILLWAAILVISPKGDALVEFGGVSRLNPVLASALAVGLLSAAGIPPLVGFLTKWYVVLAAVGRGYYISAIIALVCSVVAGVYYLRLVQVMFVGPSTMPLVETNILRTQGTAREPLSILMGVSLYLVLTIIVCPSLFFQLTHLSIFDLFFVCPC